MSQPEENALVAKLIERLLMDAELRARFRREPVAVCHEFGLLDVAEELEASGKALYTLEIRESKSSLAGVLMAAAAEGVGVAEFARYVHGARSLSPEAAGAAHRALSSPRLQAVGAPPAAGGGAAGGAASAAAAVDGKRAAPQAAQASSAAPASAAPAEPAPAAPAEPAPAPPAEPAPVAPPEPSAAPAAAAASAADVAGGSGGGAQSAAEQLLNNPRITFSTGAQADLANADPRVVSALGSMAAQHDISVGAVKDGGFEITAVDGKPVDPSNVAARDLTEALAELPSSAKPSSVGSPWLISSPGYFSDAEHQNVIHVGYSGPPPAPAAEPAAAPAVPPASPPAQAPAAPAASAAPAAGTPAAPAAPPAPPAAPVAPAAPPAAPPPPAPGGSAVLAAVPDSAQAQAQGAHGTVQFAAVADQHAAAAPPGAAPADAFDVLPDGSDTYPGDNAPKEQIAAWMARQAHKAGLPGELPVMASLVESGLHNEQFGDRDSIGYFQMRTGIWDEGPYKGFEHHPELQLKWFLDHALAVKQERLAAGDRAFLHDPSKWGDWIADVERPAEQYRGRYQLRLDEARGLLHQAGPPAPSPAAAAAQAAPAVAEQVAAPVPAGPDQARALAAIAVARKYLGTPYHWGGADPSTGFDCSGLVQWAYKQVGIDLPRVTYTQVNVGEHIDRAHLEPGDILFFRDSTGDIHHEALYIGGDKFIHAPHTGDVIKISSLDEPYYKEQFMGGRRVAQLAAPGSPVPQVPGAPAPAAAAPPVAPAAPAAPPVAPAPPAAPAAPPAAPPPGGSAVLAAVPDHAQANAAPAPPRSTVKFLPAVDSTPSAASAPPASAPPAGAPVDPSHPADAASGGSSSAAAADAASAIPAGPDAYPGDGAPREQIAAWMARKAHEAGLPGELPVMASLVESGMTNIQGGDRDSVGFFQMRTGIWDEGPYKGFEHRPDLQLKWFLDHALAVKQERLAAGDRAFLHDPSKWGDWIADVERPAKQYRGRYQLRLDEARRLLGPQG